MKYLGYTMIGLTGSRCLTHRPFTISVLTGLFLNHSSKRVASGFGGSGLYLIGAKQNGRLMTEILRRVNKAPHYTVWYRGRETDKSLWPIVKTG